MIFTFFVQKATATTYTRKGEEDGECQIGKFDAFDILGIAICWSAQDVYFVSLEENVCLCCQSFYRKLIGQEDNLLLNRWNANLQFCLSHVWDTFYTWIQR